MGREVFRCKSTCHSIPANQATASGSRNKHEQACRQEGRLILEKATVTSLSNGWSNAVLDSWGIKVHRVNVCVEVPHVPGTGWESEIFQGGLPLCRIAPTKPILPSTSIVELVVSKHNPCNPLSTNENRQTRGLLCGEGCGWDVDGWSLSKHLPTYSQSI